MLRSSLKSWYVRGIQINVIAGGVGVASAFIAIMARLCARARLRVRLCVRSCMFCLLFFFFFKFYLVFSLGHHAEWLASLCVCRVGVTPLVAPSPQSTFVKKGLGAQENDDLCNRNSRQVADRRRSPAIPFPHPGRHALPVAIGYGRWKCRRDGSWAPGKVPSQARP